MSDKSDRELVRLAQQGDLMAYDALVRKYQNRVLNLIGNYVSDRAAAYDVAQEAFLKAWRGLPKFRGDSKFYTWLFRIAVNCAKNHLVAQKRRGERQAPVPADGEGPSIEEMQADLTTPEQEEEARQLERALNDALSGLSEELRVAISLCEIEGMSYEEIAHVVQCPVGTVRSRIFRARQSLEQSLRPYLEGGLKPTGS